MSDTATTPPTLILASTSLFRRELLSRLHIPFQCAKPDTDETPLAGELPEATALRLSEAKARAVAHNYPNALIIGSDQVAYLGTQVFGKPGNHAAAVRQLQTMRGQTIRFFTGLCLLNSATNNVQVLGVPTEVSFRQLDDQEIERYLIKEQPYQCAGSAKSEGLGVALMQRMTSDDPTALIGLPLIALCQLLRREGVAII